MLKPLTAAGVDLEAPAAQLPDEGAAAFAKIWEDLMACIAEESARLARSR